MENAITLSEIKKSENEVQLALNITYCSKQSQIWKNAIIFVGNKKKSENENIPVIIKFHIVYN